MTAPLRKVRRTAEGFEKASAALRDAIREAQRAGASLREIGEATGDLVSHEHVQRICSSPAADTADTLGPARMSETTPLLVQIDRPTFSRLRKTAREQGATLGEAARQVLRDQLEA